MAGWKLRKDKATAETAGAEAETTGPAVENPTAVAEKPPRGKRAPSEETPLSEEMPDAPVFLDLPPTLPDFDAEAEPHFSGLTFDHEPETPLHADGGSGPLTLVDYTEPTTAFETHAHSYDAHSYDSTSFDSPSFDAPGFDAPAIAMPPPEMPEAAMPEPIEALEPAANYLSLPPASENVLPELDEETEFEPLHASSWLSSDFSAGIPAVAPFVIDAPVPEAPAAAPQLVVHIGRLSATFDVVKDVTTIGRPDSALHYYPDIEIEMDDAVSRRHAEIVRRPDGHYLVDTGSTNGTSLNGELLLPHQERRLAHGDRIRVGDRTEITFE